MTNTKLIARLLHLVDVRVRNISFRGKGKELYLTVKPFQNGCCCPDCGHRGTIVRILPDARVWRDVCVCGWTVFFLYCPKEIHCPTHGRVQEKIPWAEPFARITYRLEFLVLVYSQVMTQKDAAQLLHVACSTFSDLLHRVISRIRDGHKVRGLRSIGIDEVSYRKGQAYITVVYDLERSVVLWVGKGKSRETIDTFFNTVLSDYQKQQIRWGCCDMSETYLGALRDHCPNAKLVLDRFHIVKALNSAVDDVRKEQWRQATADERKALKGLRWLLFKHASRRSESDRQLLERLQKGNRRIYRACVLKDEFDLFWTYETPVTARWFLNRWCTAALQSRLDPLRKFVRTLQTHAENIVTFIESGGLTNAVAEGINRIIRFIKNRASGFIRFESFADLIYLVVGDMDIPAQIPKRFHTV